MNCMMRLLFYSRKIPVKNYFYESKRHLLAATSLGLDRFLEVQKVVSEKIKDKEKFLRDMEEVSNSDSDTLVFTDDIKKIVMLVSEKNLEIIPKLLKKFSLQNETLKFQKYTFGPDIMKLYHLHNKPTEALALVEDKVTVQHFIQVTSFSVLSDLLFKNGMYEDVICVYQYFQSKAVVYRNPVQPMVVLYFAACYKLNSKVSLEEALKLWRRLHDSGVRIHKRAAAFFALLTLNQNKPQISIEVINSYRPDPALLSIKIMSLSKAKRYDDIFVTLSEAFSSNSTLFITSDAVAFVENVLGSEKADYVPKFDELMDEYKSNNLISDKSLEDLLFQEVEVNLTSKKLKEQRQ